MRNGLPRWQPNSTGFLRLRERRHLSQDGFAGRVSNGPFPKQSSGLECQVHAAVSSVVV